MQQIIAPHISLCYLPAQMRKNQRRKKLEQYFSPDIWRNSNENAAKLLWLLKLRWAALIAQTLCIFPGIHFGFINADHLVLFIITICLLVIVNFISIRRLAHNSTIQHKHLFFQMFFDLATLSSLLFLSGGSKNPFISLLFFHAALSPLLLSGAWNIFYFLLITVSIATLHSLQAQSFEIYIHSQTFIFLSTQIAIAFAIWQFTSWLAQALCSFRDHAKQLEHHENRMDRLRAIGALASGFNHEFATPLNTLKIKIDRIRRNLGKHEKNSIAQDLQIAEEAIDQCSNALKNFHNAQVDPNTYTLQKVHIVLFLKKVCESWYIGSPKAHLILPVLKFEKYTSAVPQLPLSQTIINILDNAYQACPQGKIQIEVELFEKELVVRFIDKGPGFPEIVLEKIGEPFITTKKEGTGLGLYNAYHLLESIGGRLTVKNLQPVGSEVSLQIPIERNE